jgi:hypothetical protein
MGSEWQTGRLGDFADIQTGPFGSQLHKRDYVDIGTPIITVEHLDCSLQVFERFLAFYRDNPAYRKRLILGGSRGIDRRLKFLDIQKPLSAPQNST